MMNKTLNNIECDVVRGKQSSQNETHLIKEEVFNSTHLSNGTEISSNKTVIVDLTWLNVTVCQAETDSQALEATLNTYLAPFGNN